MRGQSALEFRLCWNNPIAKPGSVADSGKPRIVAVPGWPN
jgi:hypothetical protein